MDGLKAEPMGSKTGFTVEMHADFIEMPFIRSYEEVAYEGRLATMVSHL